MNNKTIKWLLFIMLCFIWGSSFKLMKDSTAGLTGMQIAAVRIFSAGIVFVPFAFFHIKKIPSDKLGTTILSAVFGNLIPAFLFAIALTKLDGSIGGILNSLTPICVAIVAILFYKEKIQTNKLLGIAIGFIGLAMLTLAPVFQGQKNIAADNLGYTLLILISTFFYGFNVNMVAHRLQGINPLHLASVALAFMTIPAGIILLQQGFLDLDFANPVVKNAVFESFLLGVLCSSLATVLFYALVQKAGGIFASIVTYGVPFVAMLLGFLDGEKITWLQVICMLIILGGVYLANRPSTKKNLS